MSYPVGNESQRLPLVNIRIIGHDGTFKTAALVDSGATATFIPKELAEAAGLRVVDPQSSAVGAGGTFATQVVAYEIDLLSGDTVIRRLSGEAEVPVEDNRIPYAVLGRDSVFEVYDITFREQQERVVFRPASRLPER